MHKIIINLLKEEDMNFKDVLNEAGYEVGPATNLENLARYASKKGIRWAEQEIRTLVKRMTSGNGRTVHDNMNDMSALIGALRLYMDDDIDIKMKERLKTSYQEVLRRIRRKAL